MKITDAHVLDLAAMLHDVADRLRSAAAEALIEAGKSKTYPIDSEFGRAFRLGFVEAEIARSARDVAAIARRFEENVGPPADPDPQDFCDQITAVRARLEVVP